MEMYQKAKCYYIKSTQGPEYYIGSTSEPLSKRFNRHKNRFKNEKCAETSKILFEKYGPETCYIELLEDYPKGCVAAQHLPV
jgi:hypothetical protein